MAGIFYEHCIYSKRSYFKRQHKRIEIKFHAKKGIFRYIFNLSTKHYIGLEEFQVSVKESGTNSGFIINFRLSKIIWIVYAIWRNQVLKGESL